MGKWKIITIAGAIVLIAAIAIVVGRIVFATKDDAANSGAQG